MVYGERLTVEDIKFINVMATITEMENKINEKKTFLGIVNKECTINERTQSRWKRQNTHTHTHTVHRTSIDLTS